MIKYLLLWADYNEWDCAAFGEKDSQCVLDKLSEYASYWEGLSQQLRPEENLEDCFVDCYIVRDEKKFLIHLDELKQHCSFRVFKEVIAQ